MNLTLKAKEQIGEFLKKIPAPTALDLTAGNGFDTAFLAESVGAKGKVFAFDIQPEAVASAKARVESLGLSARCDFFSAPHELLASLLPKKYFGKINAAMLNLGYLPNSDKRVITRPSSTIAALKALQGAAEKGRNKISVLSYRAHDGGEEEFREVSNFLEKFSPKIYSDFSNPKSPALFIFGF
ncbi:MAG: methyltransferase domain-containing protein [Opitutales bacterium]|nr:methyltransferase domain-containing protein [Opitutales bacterium]